MADQDVHPGDLQRADHVQPQELGLPSLSDPTQTASVWTQQVSQPTGHSQELQYKEPAGELSRQLLRGRGGRRRQEHHQEV